MRRPFDSAAPPDDTLAANPEHEWNFSPPMSSPLPLARKECPPGACVCDLRGLLGDPAADARILMLTRDEEKKLIARIEGIDSYAALNKLAARMNELLGLSLHIAPGANEVRTVRGLVIELAEARGLCRKTRQAIPAAIRKCLDRHPEIVYAILDAHDLFGINAEQQADA
jgi:hypothetical protein